MNWLEEHAFYLSGEQCAELSQITEKESKTARPGFRRIYGEFKSNEEMNDSFLIE